MKSFKNFELLIQSMSQDRMMLLLRELMRNSKRSDRDLARILKVSQPTLTRTRKRLEREGYILDYTIIPNLIKLGYEIVAFTFLGVSKQHAKTGELDQELEETARKWVTHSNTIIFGASGEGLEGKNCMMISVHRNFTEFTDFINEFRTQWSSSIKDMDTFLVSLKSKIPKRFSFRNLDVIL
jgi:DNA-binding Lrp family transcriptional regulator